MVVITVVQCCTIILGHILIYALHCDFINIFKFIARKIQFYKQSQYVYQYAPHNIPDRAYNYAEYRDGLVSDDFRYIELAEFFHKNDDN